MNMKTSAPPSHTFKHSRFFFNWGAKFPGLWLWRKSDFNFLQKNNPPRVGKGVLRFLKVWQHFLNKVTEMTKHACLGDVKIS